MVIEPFIVITPLLFTVTEPLPSTLASPLAFTPIFAEFSSIFELVLISTAPEFPSQVIVTPLPTFIVSFFSQVSSTEPLFPLIFSLFLPSVTEITSFSSSRSIL